MDERTGDLWMRFAAAGAVLLLAVSAGCGGSEREPVFDGTYEAQSERPMRIESAGGCRTTADCPDGRFCFQESCVFQCKEDADCADGDSCNALGQCGVELGGEEGSSARALEHTFDLAQALPDLEVVEKPATEVEVQAGQAEVTFTAKLSGVSPQEGIAYRVKRSDGLTDAARLQRSAPGDVFEFTLEAGRAAPDAEQPAPVSATITSAVGDFDVLMRPAPTWEGAWNGQVELESLGGQGLPLEIWVVGDGPETMKLALPVGAEQLFSPRDDYDENRGFEVAELSWKESLGVYQAVFEYEYRFENGAFADLPSGQIKRTLRLDVTKESLENGRIAGRVMDLWQGLYEAQSKTGIRQVGDLIQYGDFEVERTGELPVDAGALSVRASERNPDPALLNAGEPAGCGASSFAVDPVKDMQDEVKWGCDGIDSATSFSKADVEAQASCAMAVSTSVRQGKTTSEQLNDYFDSEASTDVPFEDFLKACADDNDEACMPLEGAECAAELLGYAARDLRSKTVEDSARLTELQSAVMVEMEAMASEAFLARQLGAFFVDLETRREWLESAAAPEEFLSAVEENTRQMMEKWKKEVLDRQIGLLERFFTDHSLLVMARPVDGEDANRGRGKLLEQGGMLWRSAIGSMEEAARRWDRQVKDDMSRAKARGELGERAVEMYVLMGLLHEFNRSAGQASQSALLVGDFADMLDALARLGLPFEDALYARDAEVVTATSLDPSRDNDSLMSQRREAALKSVEEARTEVESLLEKLQAEALSEAKLRDRLNRQRRSSANRIAEICGVPPECSAEELVSKPDKCLRVADGWCGLNDPAPEGSDVVMDPTSVSASEAGSALLEVLKAYHNLGIARDDLQTHLNQLQLDHAELKAFKADIDHWNQYRLDGVAQLEANLEMRDSLRDAELKRLADGLAEQAAIRKSGIESMRQNVAKWNRMRISGAQSSFESVMREFALRAAGDSAQLLTETVSIELQAAADALPTVVGTSSDPSSVARSRLSAAARYVEHGGKIASLQLNKAADAVAARRDFQSALGEAQLETLQDQADLAGVISEDQLASIEARMEQTSAVTDAEIAALEDAIELAEAQSEAYLAFEKDYAEFRERRTEFRKQLEETGGLELKVARAEFNIMQKGAEYRRIVQKAMLEMQSFRELNAQLSNLNQLLGGKSVVFLRFQQLRRAEDNLDVARAALMDWLVVLEYYAVRPFIAQRIKILLARNAYDLEAIAEELKELENNCGGSERSAASADLSLRTQVLGIDRAQVDSQGREIPAGDRFRETLSSGFVPVDRRIRYRTSTSLGDVLERDNGLLTTTFSLRLDRFANLPLACNAKLESFAVQLVGEGLGEGQPSVSLIYDGAAQIRSCQPDIEEYVNAFAPGLTSYGEIAYLRTEGRSASPNAAINTFPEDSRGQNRTLTGLPLASQYTLLIDTTLPNNKKLDWSKLEDIKIRLNYNYQDLFPTKCD